MTYDLKIVGGEIVDGTGGPRRRGLISRPRGVHAVVVNGEPLPPSGQVPARPTDRLLRQTRMA